jgi:hypothetical protein
LVNIWLYSSKSRNRLTNEKVEKLVYIYWNQRIRKELRGELTPDVLEAWEEQAGQGEDGEDRDNGDSEGKRREGEEREEREETGTQAEAEGA